MRILVVDDEHLARDRLRRMLDALNGYELVGEAANGMEAVKRCEELKPDLVLLDLLMPVMDGMTALPLLLKAKPGVQVIMASTLTRKNAEVSLRALADGAADYVTKPTSTSELHSADAFKRELNDKIKAVAAASLPTDRASTGRQSRTSRAASLSARRSATREWRPSLS